MLKGDGSSLLACLIKMIRENEGQITYFFMRIGNLDVGFSIEHKLLEVVSTGGDWNGFHFHDRRRPRGNGREVLENEYRPYGKKSDQDRITVFEKKRFEIC